MSPLFVHENATPYYAARQVDQVCWQVLAPGRRTHELLESSVILRVDPLPKLAPPGTPAKARAPFVAVVTKLHRRDIRLCEVSSAEQRRPGRGRLGAMRDVARRCRQRVRVRVHHDAASLHDRQRARLRLGASGYQFPPAVSASPNVHGPQSPVSGTVGDSPQFSQEPS